MTCLNSSKYMQTCNPFIIHHQIKNKKTHRLKHLIWCKFALYLLKSMVEIGPLKLQIEILMLIPNHDSPALKKKKKRKTYCRIFVPFLRQFMWWWIVKNKMENKNILTGTSGLWTGNPPLNPNWAPINLWSFGWIYTALWSWVFWRRVLLCTSNF